MFIDQIDFVGAHQLRCHGGGGRLIEKAAKFFEPPMHEMIGKKPPLATSPSSW